LFIDDIMYGLDAMLGCYTCQIVFYSILLRVAIETSTMVSAHVELAELLMATGG
jgi:hypothetical protein